GTVTPGPAQYAFAAAHPGTLGIFKAIAAQFTTSINASVAKSTSTDAKIAAAVASAALQYLAGLLDSKISGSAGDAPGLTAPTMPTTTTLPTTPVVSPTLPGTGAVPVTTLGPVATTGPGTVTTLAGAGAGPLGGAGLGGPGGAPGLNVAALSGAAAVGTGV